MNLMKKINKEFFGAKLATKFSNLIDDIFGKDVVSQKILT